jgi:hypothetical protein
MGLDDTHMKSYIRQIHLKVTFRKIIVKGLSLICVMAFFN